MSILTMPIEVVFPMLSIAQILPTQTATPLPGAQPVNESLLPSMISMLS